uniref:Uncharacterized protein n=1 Tax=Sphingobacterium sp. (strain 21) TaxID=743722 RepID=F4C2E2_SPHS2
MESINTFFEGDNIGSLAVIEIAHINDFLNFNPPLFREGRDWKQIEFLPESGQLSPTYEEDDNGNVYSYKGSFSIKRPSIEEESAMLPFIGKKSVLRLTDMNMRVRIIGLPDCPVAVKMTGTTGNKYTSAPSNDYSFAVDQPVKAIG